MKYIYIEQLWNYIVEMIIITWLMTLVLDTI